MSGRALYTGTVAHRRPGPAAHAFRVPVLMAWVPLGELPGVFDDLPGWSSRRPAPVWLRRADYGDGGDGPLDAFVRDLVAERLGERPDGPVAMLTHPRTLGYVLNPLTLYVCGEPGAPEALVLEVTNTPWGERHWYAVPGSEARGGRFAKDFHVSPFLTLDGAYVVDLDLDGSRLRLDLRLEQDGATAFEARLDLRRRALTPRSAAGALLGRPANTLRVWAGIHREAFALWRKRVPFVPHPGRRPAAGTR
jgi:hypothetical protein